MPFSVELKVSLLDLNEYKLPDFGVYSRYKNKDEPLRGSSLVGAQCDFRQNSIEVSAGGDRDRRCDYGRHRDLRGDHRLHRGRRDHIYGHRDVCRMNCFPSRF